MPGKQNARDLTGANRERHIIEQGKGNSHHTKCSWVACFEAPRDVVHDSARNRAAPWQRLSPGGHQAGDEIRTQDIHVGNVREVSSINLHTQDLQTMAASRCRTR